MKVGVLALQGDVPEHARAAAEAARDEEVVLVRRPRDLEGVEALLMPGGESTTIAGLLERNRLFEPLAERLKAGLPVLATCAGLILLAQRLERSEGGRDPKTLGVLDVLVRRNDYGAQRESFEAPVRVEGLSGAAFPGVFIRAPRILEVGPGARPIAWRGEEVVGAAHGLAWGLTFHPELAPDRRLLAHFLAEARRAGQSTKKSSRAMPRRAVPTATATQ
ncbi:MAG TPA: pyridoxal 5'-phosphate synthase glutaminase subunit PdxT [Thermoplasmata archaeon]|nr:pyridoxal 5'-phosphate synthase glutaminase subunit PdxT [Thermoplasmata archaeon]